MVPLAQPAPKQCFTPRCPVVNCCSSNRCVKSISRHAHMNCVLFCILYASFLFFFPLPSFLVKTRIIASCALLDVFATHFSDHITITSSSVLCRERAPVPLLYEDMDPPFLLATTSCFTLLIEMYWTSAVSPGTDVIPLAA